ncbi:hypothetical protein Sjap_012824 [Stephania japonica]|uniref:Uncharacterized protein n=1 Tax=Stephania japonica TaxID=461633 RepID=A0AAP0IWN3_9MAGN
MGSFLFHWEVVALIGCGMWESSKVVASLSKENDEIFGFCRFSQTANNDEILYITTTRGERGNIVYSDTTLWKRIGSKQIIRDRITAYTWASFILDSTG